MIDTAVSRIKFGIIINNCETIRDRFNRNFIPTVEVFYREKISFVLKIIMIKKIVEKYCVKRNVFCRAVIKLI